MTNTPLERLAYYLGMSKPKQALLLPRAFLVFGLLLAYFLPRLDRFVPGGAPITQIFLELIWFALMVFGVLGHRKSYRKKYGEMAYRAIAFRFFIPAGILMLNGIVRPIWVAGGDVPLFVWLRILLGLYFLAMGILLEIKGIKSLGIDRVVFIYTVFPERGTQVQSALYEYLRHPLYAAMSHIALGIALLSGTFPGLLCSLIFVLKLWLWSKLEEKELIERFGESYRNYQKKVPAFFPKLNQLKGFVRIVFKFKVTV